MTSDDLLWSRSRTGDPEAFATLFDRHARLIYNYCFRRVGGWSEAEDLLSVVFLEAWRRRDQALPPGKVVPWLLGVATNVVRNHRRSLRRYAAALARMPRPRAEDTVAEDAVERIDDERRAQPFLAAFSRLPRREQEVLALCGWFELSYEDTALALGIPVGTVRSRLSRGRRRLQELGSAFGHEARVGDVEEVVER